METLGGAMAKYALDATALRHQAIAQNLANLHSENYVPLQVDFAAQLDALQRGRRPGPPSLVPQPGKLPGPRPQDVDMEMVAMSHNAIHYQALIKGLGTQFAILGAAIGDGRRA
jgi:flagellar basal-body rod protein FlgB